MPDREKVIKGLECCTRYEVGKQLNDCLYCPYIEPIGFNQFRCKSQEMKEDALALLKEQEEQKRKWLRSIADNQLANAPSDMMDEKTKEHFSGVWCGLEIAYGILTEES